MIIFRPQSLDTQRSHSAKSLQDCTVLGGWWIHSHQHKSFPLSDYQKLKQGAPCIKLLSNIVYPGGFPTHGQHNNPVWAPQVTWLVSYLQQLSHLSQVQLRLCTLLQSQTIRAISYIKFPGGREWKKLMFVVDPVLPDLINQFSQHRLRKTLKLMVNLSFKISVVLSFGFGFTLEVTQNLFLYVKLSGVDPTSIWRNLLFQYLGN